MKLLGIIVLLTALSFSCQPASAQELVSAKLLPAPAELRAEIAKVNAGFDDPALSSSRAVHQKHWTKAGKIMTYIGIPLLAAGTGALAYGLSTQNSSNCSGTCFSVDWKATGAIWLSGGAVLTIIGATRRSTD